jgi:hypothetical protein
MKELLKIGITVLVVLVVYDMFIAKMVNKSNLDELDEPEV